MSLQSIRKSIRIRKLQDQVFMYFAVFCLLSGLLVLIALVLQLFVTAIGYSFIDEVEIERTAVQMVTTINANPDSPAVTEVAGLNKVLETAQANRLTPAIPATQAMVTALEGAIQSGAIPKEKAETINAVLVPLKASLEGSDTAANKLNQFSNAILTLDTELSGIELPPPAATAYNEAKSVITKAQDQILNIIFTGDEDTQFNQEFSQLFVKVNAYAQKAVEIRYSDDPEAQETAMEKLESANPAMAEIFSTSEKLCEGEVFRSGGSWMCKVPSKLTPRFVGLPSSASHEDAGVKIGVFGTFGVIIVMSILAIPLGVAAGVFLEEYAPNNFVTNFIEINITNLAGVPAIVYGLLALGIFKVWFGPSILTGGCTLACLILPVIIVTTRESIKAIPVGIREGAFALGASKWVMIKDHLLPYSIGGILTGIIIGLSRAIGEAAPLITIGAAGLILFTPFESPPAESINLGPFNWLLSQFTAMPILMFDWVQRPQRGFQTNAAAAGVVLVVMTLILNGIAIYVRSYSRNRIKW